jgi:uncharacterized protein YegL
MVGEQILGVQDGMASIIKSLKTDPYALETVYIGIVIFAGKAKVITPLSDIISFYPPKFPIGSGTSLGAGLELLMQEMKKNHVPTTAETKGDWKPIVFLFTDGASTDDTRHAFDIWKSTWRGKANLVAVAFGDNAVVQELSTLTENVFLFNNATVESYKSFFKWVTASIQVSSIGVEKGAEGFGLAKTDQGTVEKIDLGKGSQVNPGKFDTNYAIFMGMCQNSHAQYLIKYRKQISDSEGLSEYGLSSMFYRLVGAYPIDKEYHTLSSESPQNYNISSEELRGVPACPSCGNQWGFAVCACGNIHCVGEEPVSHCPWCGNSGTYGFGNNPINVNRKQG